MSELKPCPFCGSKAHTSLIQSMWFVECDNKDCGALMGFDAEKVSQEEAISAWNRRAQPANEPLTNTGGSFNGAGNVYNGTGPCGNICVGTGGGDSDA